MNFNEGPVKYFDFQGQSAVDNNHKHTLLSELRRRGEASQDENLAGFRVSFNENSLNSMPEIGVLAYLYTKQDREGNKISRVTAKDVAFKASDFFGLFKRFDLLLVDQNLISEGVEVDGPHYK